MTTDLTLKQFQTQIGEVGTVEVKDGVATINMNLVTGKTYLDLNSVGMVEFVYKLIEACSKAEAMANQAKLPGERSASFPEAFETPPQLNAEGKNRTLSTQRVSVQIDPDSKEILPYLP